MINSRSIDSNSRLTFDSFKISHQLADHELHGRNAAEKPETIGLIKVELIIRDQQLLIAADRAERISKISFEITLGEKSISKIWF